MTCNNTSTYLASFVFLINSKRILFAQFRPRIASFNAKAMKYNAILLELPFPIWGLWNIGKQDLSLVKKCPSAIVSEHYKETKDYWKTNYDND